MYLYNNEQYESLPERITLPDGMTRTSLHELTKEEQESLGLIEYTVITPEYDSLLKQWDGSYTFDHDNKTATKNIIDRDSSIIKQDRLNTFLQEQLAIQQAGFTSTNNIKLQVMEQDLTRWTQLMTGILAFSPETVNVIDYDNVIHNLTLQQAKDLLQEVFVWGQTFIINNRLGKDAILNS